MKWFSSQKPSLQFYSGIIILCLLCGLIGTPLIHTPASTISAQAGESANRLSAPDFTIFADGLASDWENWSWNTVVNFNSREQVHSGATALAATFSAGWAGLSLHTSQPVQTGNYTALEFWAFGGAGGTQITFFSEASDSSGAGPSISLSFPAGIWTHFSIPLSELGSPGAIARLNWMDRTGASQPPFYLDDIKFLGNPSPPPVLSLSVDAAADRKMISPYIYGINLDAIDGSGDASFFDELDLPVRRWGGNATSRYNYQYDISNHAMDWFFENNKESNATNLPEDSAVNRFINMNRSVGAQSFLVMPMTGYVARNDAFACSYDKDIYGAQQAYDVWRPECGNGISLNGNPITGNNPLDTSLAIGPAFVSDWVSSLVNRYGTAANGGVMFYNTDNEPDLWFETHRDVAPVGLTFDQLRQRIIDYGVAIKTSDSTAQVLGPSTGIWSYYFESPYDGQRGDWASPDDRNAHAGAYLTPWLLDQFYAFELAQGVRVLDYLDLHYYPQAGVALVEAGDAARQALRLRSTRSLWDPTYIDESWIAQAGPDSGIVQLIPRMRTWVDQNYPGTKLAIGEYNWGGLEHMNGALAQADVLGIFGREGVDLATLWDPPTAAEPGAYAFRIFRNYDGLGGKFGDIHIRAISTDQERLAIYAAQRQSDLALTLVILNKTNEELTSSLSMVNFNAKSQAQIFRYGQANLSAIVQLPDLAVTAAGFSMTYPANSITMIVLPAETRKVYLPLISRQSSSIANVRE
jgi:hypothetical protein